MLKVAVSRCHAPMRVSVQVLTLLSLRKRTPSPPAAKQAVASKQAPQAVPRAAGKPQPADVSQDPKPAAAAASQQPAPPLQQGLSSALPEVPMAGSLRQERSDRGSRSRPPPRSEAVRQRRANDQRH